jgi:hypothetical protein
MFGALKIARGKIMSEFWRLLEESVIIQSIVTLVIICVIGYMVVTGKPMPKEFWAIAGSVIGFWFGSKAQMAERRGGEYAARNIALAAKVGETCKDS